MPRNPMVVRTVPALRRALDALRARKASVALVPTMGALHDGQMARDLGLVVRVIGSKTVRERDGLAMSSRNVYLSPAERQVASTLYRAMKQAAANIRAGEDVAAAVASAADVVNGAGFALDYLE